LIEEFEHLDVFREVRKKLTVKLLATDSEVLQSNTRCIFKPPNRESLWNEALKNKEFTTLLDCINKSSPDRRDSVGERIRDLYSTVSNAIHHRDDGDEILILKRYMCDHEAKLSVCLCKHYKVFYREVMAFVAQDPDPDILQEDDC